MAHFLKKECGKNEDRATRKKISQAQLVNEWQCPFTDLMQINDFYLMPH